jgi:hypothetical protein
MEKADQDEQRRRHIDGFVNSFLDRTKSERFRSFLLDPKRRSEITDTLNHKIAGYLIAEHITPTPPLFQPSATAYVISDEREIDDTFVDAATAVHLVENAYFGTVASIVPGVLVAVKGEAPAKVVWLYRPNKR